MKRRADNRFGELVEPASFSELIELVIGTKEDPADVRMWRGQADESWLLHSGAYRKLLLSPDPPTGGRVASYERRLLDKATHRGFRYFEGRELSDFELLARLQHHGAATRLIDTTRNALTGLYFACSTLPHKAGILFGIHSNNLGGGEGMLLTARYEDQIRQIDVHEHPQTWEPPGVSRRISAQHSQFIYSGIRQNLPHGSLALGDPRKYLLAVRVSPEQKTEYLNILARNFDITSLSLFPDLDGFGAAHSSVHEQWSTERW